MQIGEMLVRAKAISPADLEEAIGWQVLYGGRLGTNLLELGLVDERVLAEALGKQLSCECVWGELELSASMVQVVPGVLARRHELVPWRVDGRRLKVLTTSPAENLAMFDEMGFRLGKQVKPVIAPEFRVHQLLRRYYESVRQMRALDFGIKPKGKRLQDAAKQAETAEIEKAADLMNDETFAAIYDQVLEGRSSPTPEVAPPAPSAVPPPGWSGTPPPRTLPPMVIPVARPPVSPPPFVARAVTPITVQTVVPPPEMKFEIEGLPTEDEEPLIEAELLDEDTGKHGSDLNTNQWVSALQDLEATLIASEPLPPPPRETSPLSFSEAVAKIGQAEDRDAVAHTVLRYARSKAARAVLLSIQGDVALGWDAMGEDLSTDVAKRIAFPLTVPSAFRLVRESRSHYIGPLGKEAGNVRFLKLAGKKWPSSAVLLPVLFRSKVVYILYVDNGHKQHVNADVGELMILSQKITRSMEQMVAQRQSARRERPG
jgi:hypothetical protein